MNEQNNLSVVRTAYLAYRYRNFDALRNCLTEDVKWFAIGPPNLIPSAGTRYGRDQVEQYFATLDGIEDIQSFEPEEFVVEEDKVVAIGDLERRIDASGNLLQSPWVHVFTLRRGKISNFRSFYDTAAAVTAIANAAQARAHLRVVEATASRIL